MKKKQDFIYFFHLPLTAHRWLKCKHAWQQHGIDPKYQPKRKKNVIYPPHFRLMVCKNAKFMPFGFWQKHRKMKCEAFTYALSYKPFRLCLFQYCPVITRDFFPFHFLLTFDFWLNNNQKWKHVQFYESHMARNIDFSEFYRVHLKCYSILIFKW